MLVFVQHMIHGWYCLSFFIKGVEQFQQALRISPQNISAQYGLASALLGLSKECINSGAFKWGASLLEVSNLGILESTVYLLTIEHMPPLQCLEIF